MIGWYVVSVRDDSRGKKPPPDIENRYQHISMFTAKHAHTHSPLSNIEFVPKAIEVDFIDRQNYSYILLKTDTLPIVRMKFIPGPSLGTFIGMHYKNPTIMEALCNAWLQMIGYLEALQMAHGDLDLSNVIVQHQGRNIVLKLIDYDNAWVPTFRDQSLEQTELGKENFQHPALQNKKTRKFDEYMDRFSALTIYISLRALTVYPDLYTNKDWGAGDSHLLLVSADYKEEKNFKPSRITMLRNLQIPDLEPLLRELSRCLQKEPAQQPRRLTELIPYGTPFFLPGEINDIKIPWTPQIVDEVYLEEDLAYFAFDEATHYKKPDEALVPPPQPTPTIDPWTQQAEWGLPQPVQQPQPAGWGQQPPVQQPQPIGWGQQPPVQQPQQASWEPTEPVTNYVPPARKYTPVSSPQISCFIYNMAHRVDSGRIDYLRHTLVYRNHTSLSGYTMDATTTYTDFTFEALAVRIFSSD